MCEGVDKWKVDAVAALKMFNEAEMKDEMWKELCMSTAFGADIFSKQEDVVKSDWFDWIILLFVVYEWNLIIIVEINNN